MLVWVNSTTFEPIHDCDHITAIHVCGQTRLCFPIIFGRLGCSWTSVLKLSTNENVSQWSFMNDVLHYAEHLLLGFMWSLHHINLGGLGCSEAMVTNFPQMKMSGNDHLWCLGLCRTFSARFHLVTPPPVISQFMGLGCSGASVTKFPKNKVSRTYHS